MFDIHLVVTMFPYPRVHAIVRSGPNQPSSLCEIGSRAVKEHHEFVGPIGQQWLSTFRDDARRLQAVLDKNVTALLSAADLRAIGETAGDRVEASCPDMDGSRELDAVLRRIDDVTDAEPTE